jgi:Nucleotide modification associated domain 3
MRALLVRVGADQSQGGGGWNGPFNSKTGEFVYVPIPETKAVRPGLEKPYDLVAADLKRFGCVLPVSLKNQRMHLDPDFGHLSYGDQGQRAKQIQAKLKKGDLLVFYAALADLTPAVGLTYAIIGLYVVESIVEAARVPKNRWDENAHTRRVVSDRATDIVVRGQREASGRLRVCLPIGEFRDRAYRVKTALLNVWGNLSCNDGYLQRSASLPEIKNAPAFYNWFRSMGVQLIQRNN